MPDVRHTEASLKRVGVTIVSHSREWPGLKCDRCGRSWWLVLRIGGPRPKGWWRCPKGCNHPRGEKGRKP